MVDVVLQGSGIDEKFLGITLFALVPNTTEFMNAISFALNGNIALRCVLVWFTFKKVSHRPLAQYGDWFRICTSSLPAPDSRNGGVLRLVRPTARWLYLEYLHVRSLALECLENCAKLRLPIG